MPMTRAEKGTQPWRSQHARQPQLALGRIGRALIRIMTLYEFMTSGNPLVPNAPTTRPHDAALTPRAGVEETLPAK